MAREPYAGTATVEPTPAPSDDYQRIDASPAAFGGVVAGAEQRGGQEIQQGATDLAQDAILRQTRFNDHVVTDAVNQLQTNAENLTYGNRSDPNAAPGLYTLKGQDALRAGPQVAQQINDQRDQIAGGLQNDAQRLAFQQQTVRYLQYKRAEIESHINQETNKYGVASETAGIGTAGTMAANAWNSDSVIGSSIADSQLHAAKLTMLNYGHPPDPATATPEEMANFNNIRQKAQQDAATHVVQQAVYGALAADPANGAARAADIVQKYGGLINPLAREELTRQTKNGADEAVVAGYLNGRVPASAAGPVQPGTPKPVDQPTQQRAQQVHDAAVAQGASDAEAWGWAANAVHESGASPTPPVGDGGISHGMFQLNRGQLAAYQASHNGHLPEQDDLATQLQFARTQAAPMLVGASGPAGYASAISRGFEVPANGAQEAANRGATAIALAGGQPTNAGGSNAPDVTVVPPNLPPLPSGDAYSYIADTNQWKAPDGTIFPGVTKASATSGGPAAPSAQGATPAPGTLSTHNPQAFSYEQQMMDTARADAQRLFPNNPVRQRQIVEGKWQQIQETNLLQAKTEAETQKAHKEAEEAIGQQVMTTLRQNPAQFNPGMIWNNPSLDWETKQKMSEVADYQLRQAGIDTAPHGPGYSDVFAGITANPNAPNSIHSMKDIWARAGQGGDLTLHDADTLSQIFTKVHKDPDEAGIRITQNAMMEYAKGILWKPSEMGGIKDQNGLNIYNGQFVPSFISGFETWQKAHPDNPMGYLNKDNLDKIIAPLKRNATQEANDRLAETGQLGPGDIEKPGTPLPPVPVINAPEEPRPEENLARNQAYVTPGQHTYNTPLSAPDETKFRQWVADNNVPFDPNAKVSDYDMRGLWKTSQDPDAWKQLQESGKVPEDMAPAGTKIDPNDGKPHYPDYWKTPFHQTFSNESQWATPNAPHWTPDDKLVASDGKVVFDDKAQKPEPINPTAWQSVMTGPLPVAENGRPYTHAAWATYLTKLMQNPTPKTIQYFDQHFGVQGYSGAEIVQRLRTPMQQAPAVAPASTLPAGGGPF